MDSNFHDLQFSEKSADLSETIFVWSTNESYGHTESYDNEMQCDMCCILPKIVRLLTDVM